MSGHDSSNVIHDPRRAPRLLNAATATLAASVLSDSTTEHYRAGFHNPAMFVAPLISASVFVTATRAALRSDTGGRIRESIFTASVLTGLVGFGFHLANTSRRIGGWSSSANVFYGAPVAAPLAATMAGVLGMVASRIGHHHASKDHARLPVSASGFRAGHLVGAIAAAGLAGTAVEAAALHFRGAFQNPLMYAPVIVPPLAAATLATAAWSRSAATRSAARMLLRLTGLLGIAGSGLHAWGVHRRMGGWHNWRQNLFAGPPLPAPPAFTGLSLAGLAALEMLPLREPQ
jgi:hypothetical protein